MSCSAAFSDVSLCCLLRRLYDASLLWCLVAFPDAVLLPCQPPPLIPFCYLRQCLALVPHVLRRLCDTSLEPLQWSRPPAVLSGTDVSLWMHVSPIRYLLLDLVKDRYHLLPCRPLILPLDESLIRCLLLNLFDYRDHLLPSQPAMSPSRCVANPLSAAALSTKVISIFLLNVSHPLSFFLSSFFAVSGFDYFVCLLLSFFSLAGGLRLMSFASFYFTSYASFLFSLQFRFSLHFHVSLSFLLAGVSRTSSWAARFIIFVLLPFVPLSCLASRIHKNKSTQHHTLGSGTAEFQVTWFPKLREGTYLVKNARAHFEYRKTMQEKAQPCASFWRKNLRPKWVRFLVIGAPIVDYVDLLLYHLTFLPLCNLSASFREEKRKKKHDKTV